MPSHRSSREVLFKAANISLIIRTAASPNGRLVVTFTPAIEPDTEKTNLGFGESFLSARGFDVLCFTSKRNHWWHVPEMEAALAMAGEVASGYRDVSGYGVSMGAYGVLAFSRRLRIANIFAVVPQITVDPARPPYDDRWAKDAKLLTIVEDDLNAGLNPDANVTFAYDPFSPDAAHIALIDAPRAIHIPCSFAGHGVSKYLQRVGVLKDLSIAAITGQCDATAIVRTIRTQRHADPAFLLSLALRCCESGRDDAANALADRARPFVTNKIVGRLIAVYHRTRNHHRLGSVFQALYEVNPSDATRRSKAIAFYGKRLREPAPMSREEMVEILRQAKTSLRSPELEALARRRIRRGEGPSAIRWPSPGVSSASYNSLGSMVRP